MVKTNGNLKVAVPTFIPLADAVRKYDLTEEVLTRLIQDGRIEAAQLPSGELLVSDESLNGKTKEQIIEEQFGHLQGKAVTISQASQKYNIAGMTIRDWIARNYITIVDDGYPVRVNEAEVAYCADIHEQRQAAGITGGVPLLDENGLPYRLKHPELSEYRRRKKLDRNR
jgi:hypothetical protein